jgi:cytidine deaminase
MSGITHQQLVKHAVEAAANAHNPYSNFSVGAALLGKNGELFVGTNIENISYGLTICAERSAFCAAITAGCREFEAIAIVASSDKPPLPCGACRQVMAEFCDGSFSIVLSTITAPTNIKVYSLDDLLPHQFEMNL